MLKNSNWLLTSNDGTNVTAVNGSRNWSGTLLAFEALKRLGDPEIVNGAPVFKNAAHQDFLSEYLEQQFKANVQQVSTLSAPAEFGVGIAQIGDKFVKCDGTYYANSGGFIPTVFNTTYSVLQAVVLDTIAEWVSKLKVVNSGANPIYIAFNEFPNVVGDSLSDLTKAGAIKVDAGDSNVFEIGTGCRMFGLVSITGTNSVKVTGGV
jgi:hypothetical protein